MGEVCWSCLEGKVELRIGVREFLLCLAVHCQRLVKLKNNGGIQCCRQLLMQSKAKQSSQRIRYLRAPEEVPTSTAVGAAKPRAQGQATTSTLHASCRLSNRGAAAPPIAPPPYRLSTCNSHSQQITRSTTGRSFAKSFCQLARLVGCAKACQGMAYLQLGSEVADTER